MNRRMSIKRRIEATYSSGRRCLLWLMLIVLGASGLLASLSVGQETGQEDLVVVVELEDAIGPASASYFTDALEDANERDASLLVLRIDTPGGLDAAMRDMIKAILASDVPVATWVAPSGARAASAGTYIMYASHFAAMAPATNMGSSTPVDMLAPESPSPQPSPFPFPSPGQDDSQDAPNASREDESDKGVQESDETSASEQTEDEEQEPDKEAVSDADADKESEPPEGATAMQRKVLNDAVAYIRGLAELRGRNADWAEESVRKGVNLTSSDALEQGVIDFVAKTLDELIEQVNGQKYETSDGQEHQLAIENPTIETVTPDWRARLLAVITNPSVAVLLISFGSLALAAEFYTGSGVAGVVGAIFLLVAAYGMQMLPLNYAGLALMLLGIGLMIAEFFTPTIGIFGFGGAVAFIFGGIFLLDTEVPGFDVSIGLLIGIATVMLLLVTFISGAALKSLRTRGVSGTESMLGEEVQALSAIDAGKEGKVLYAGEVWTGIPESNVNKDDMLQVTAVKGLKVYARPRGEPGTQGNSE